MTSTQGAVPTFSQGLLDADLGPLASGATATVTLVASPGPSNTGPLTAGFTVQGQNIDPDPSNNSAQVTFDVAPATDLAVAILPGPGPAVAQVGLDLRPEGHEPGPLGRPPA